MSQKGRQLQAAVQQHQAAAKIHAKVAAHYQGAIIGQQVMRYAEILKWGKPVRVGSNRDGDVVFQFKAGTIVSTATKGRIVIFPSS
jgi:hypothetical protein